MNKLAIIALLALTPLAAIGEEQGRNSGLSPAMLTRSGRAIEYFVPAVRTNGSPTAGLCTITATAPGTYPGQGRDGFMGQATIENLSAVTWTSTIGQPAYPGRLAVDLYDASANDTLTCSYLLIVGYNWSGVQVNERIAPLVEGIQYTVNSFRKVTSIRAYGCGDGDGTSEIGGDDAGDILRVRSSQWVALPWALSNAETDMDVACSFHATSAAPTGATQLPRCMDASTLTFHEPSNSVNVLSTSLGSGVGAGCQSDRSSIILRGRASPSKTKF